MEPSSSLQQFEQGVLRVHAYLDAHPWALVGLILILVAMVAMNIWNKRRVRE